MTVSTAIAIDAPVPAEPKYTLIRAADATPLADGHWRAGVALIPYPGPPHFDTSPASYPGQGDLCDVDPIVFSDMPDVSDHLAFAVYNAVQCTTRTYSPAELAARIRTVFDAYAHQMVEAQFMSGILSTATPFLADGTATFLGSKGVVEGMGLLEQEAAKIGGNAMIHMSPRLATAVTAHNLLRVDGQSLRTIAGNTQVVPGGGYDGTASSGDTANSAAKEYAYLTDQVRVVRGDIMVFPDADNPEGGVAWSTNDAQALAEREYITLYDPDKTFAVQIDRAA